MSIPATIVDVKRGVKLSDCTSVYQEAYPRSACSRWDPFATGQVLCLFVFVWQVDSQLAGNGHLKGGETAGAKGTPWPEVKFKRS